MTAKLVANLRFVVGRRGIQTKAGGSRAALVVPAAAVAAGAAGALFIYNQWNDEKRLVLAV